MKYFYVAKSNSVQMEIDEKEARGILEPFYPKALEKAKAGQTFETPNAYILTLI
jgi:hypothetical protein